MGARGPSMSNADLDSLKSSLAVLKETRSILEKKRKSTPASGRPPLIQKLAELNSDILNLELFIAHINAANTQVLPPTPESFQEMDAALAELEALKRSTDSVSKAIQLATTIAALVGKNREEIQSRTVPPTPT
jgi:hypothetical protein